MAAQCNIKDALRKYCTHVTSLNSAQYMLIERLYSGINETKQCELELTVSCPHNHSVNL